MKSSLNGTPKLLTTSMADFKNMNGKALKTTAFPNTSSSFLPMHSLDSQYSTSYGAAFTPKYVCRLPRKRFLKN